ncbi:DNA polymerase III subunit gamma/tau [Chloroflexota bacterium]
MTSQVFYRKWRSQNLDEIVGQEPVTQTLRNALSSGRISHAYLFCGPRGTGKTSTARVLAKAVNCLSTGDVKPCNTCDMCLAITNVRALDVIEIDAASNTGVDDIRSLREKVNYAPNQARYKVYIIDEVHMLSNSASNALLKTLEEPPEHVIFILATTESHKILPTIMSRCQRFDFRRIAQADVIARLDYVCGQEGITMEPEGQQLIARSATGSLRDAINLLEQLTTYYGSEISFQQVQSMLGISGDWRVRELVKQIITGDVAAGVTTINSVNSDGIDLKQFNRELVEYLRSLLLIKTGSDDSVDLSAEDVSELKTLASGASLKQILSATRLFGQLELGFENYPTLPLELALVDSVLDTAGKETMPGVETKSENVRPGKTVSPDPVPPVVEKQVAKPPEPEPEMKNPSREKLSAVEPDVITTSEPEPVIEDSEPEIIMEEPEPELLVDEPELEPVTVTEELDREQEEVEPVTAPAPSGALGDGEAIEQLRQNWRRVIEEAPQDMKRSPALAILRSAGVTPLVIENGTVVLAFRHKIHKEKIELPENQRAAEKILGNFLGFDCQINCVLEDNHLLREALKIGKLIDTEEK